MRIDFISSVPDLLRSPLDHSIIKNARDKGLVEIEIHDLRDYSEDKHKKVDDYTYGGGAGMVLTPQPIFSCVSELTNQRTYDAIIFPTPDAPVYEQKDANRLSLLKNIIFICGHYKGVDQRVRDRLVTHEWSIGDYVLSGGELPSLAIADSIIRLLPGVLGDATSALEDSHQDGFLSAPVYTRPASFDGLEVPEVLRSGDHKKITDWRNQQAEEKTKAIRPDLYKKVYNEH